MEYRFLTLLILLIGFTAPHNFACTIFMAHSGKQVWVGNNEDEDPRVNYRLWYYPATAQKYGYMLWTELTSDKKLNEIIYKNPQGGMNEWGLFLDYTAIDEIPVQQDPTKQNRTEEVVTSILQKCKTVNEALQYISQFNLIRLSAAQLFIGDASGDYATVHGAYVIGRSSKNFALTNYCIKDNYHEACWRRDVATQYLNIGKHYQLKDIVSILQKTAQKKPSNLVSNYSMASNLHTKTIHLYYKNDFTTARIINLAQELKKGKHYRDMASYFPLSLAPILAKKYSEGGINSVIVTYEQLKKQAAKKYNFQNNDVIDFATQLLAKGQANETLRLLQCLERNGFNQLEINAWLGLAYRLTGRVKESKLNFAKVLLADSTNYVATLFGKQKDHKVSFNLNDFEGAEQVSLIGDFSNWAPIAMKKEKGSWKCEVELTPGVYNYKFIVNKEYLADQLNLMYTGTGPKIFSKLYVW